MVYCRCSHEKHERHENKGRPRRFRVPRLAEPPNLPQQQTQVVGRALQRVRFDHILLTPQPSPPSTAGLAYMRKGSFASLASPAVQPSAFRATHSSPVGPKRGLVLHRFVAPASHLLSPLMY